MSSLIRNVVFCLLLSGFCLSGISQENSYVTVKQDGTGNYKTITEALDDSNRESNEIVVYAGIYKENITINDPVILRAYDGPNFTIIDGSSTVNNKPDVIKVSASVKDVEIIGFYITGGANGIYLDTSCKVTICNCVIHANNQNGIYAIWKTSSAETVINIINNVISDNKQNGLSLNDDQTLFTFFPAVVKNNIITNNLGYGLRVDYSAAMFNKEKIVIDYNNFYNNITGNYSTGIGRGEFVPVGSGDISKEPLFLSESKTPSGFDARLQSKSPCKDKGEMNLALRDPDGTRSDMGAFGGPWAATFYESPNDGPVVRNVNIVPASIPKGEKFTIKATGSVR